MPDRRSLGRLREAHRLALPQHLAGIGRQHARHDLHERRLARAVLAHQQMHLPGLDLQVAVAQRRDAAEPLLNAPEMEKHRDETLQSSTMMRTMSALRRARAALKNFLAPSAA